jgi:hypothetical protein
LAVAVLVLLRQLLIVFLVSLIGILPLMLGVAMFAAGLWPLAILAVAFGVAWILLVSLISSALNAIIVGALYLYAAEGRVPRLFNDRLLADAFVTQ